MPKRACIVNRNALEYDTRMVQQLSALRQNGYTCDVLCLRASGERFRQEDRNTRVWQLSTARTGKLGPIGYLWNICSFAARASGLLLVLTATSRFDVVIVHTLPEALVFVAWPCKLLGARIVLDARDLTVELLRSRIGGRARAPFRGMARIFERMAGAFADHVITASPGFKRALSGRGTNESKVTVLVNGADDRIFVYDAGRPFSRIRKGAKLIYHGTVSSRFGVVVAVEALSIVNRSVPGSELHVYGYYDRAYRSVVEERARALGVAESLRMHEPIPLDELGPVLSSMDLGVVPYLSDRFMNLALSTKTFEYIAAGIPVVASRLLSTAELFSSQAIRYVDPGNAEDLAAQIVDLCCDPEARRALRERAHHEYAQYSTAVRQAAYLTVIEAQSDRRN